MMLHRVWLIVSWCLHQWRNNLPFTEIQPLDEDIQIVLDEQDSIGWSNFCFGLVGQSFITTQQTYLESLGKQASGKSWVSQIIWKV